MSHAVIENDIKTLKSRARINIHAPPYHLCRQLLIWLVLCCVTHLSMEPTFSSIDDYGPRGIFLQKALNYKRDLRIRFGDYAQGQVSFGDSDYNMMESVQNAQSLCGLQGTDRVV